MVQHKRLQYNNQKQTNAFPSNSTLHANPVTFFIMITETSKTH